MKIIKRGVNPKDKKFRGICQHCQTEVEFRKSEGRIVFDQRDGDYIVVKCPICKQSINVGI